MKTTVMILALWATVSVAAQTPELKFSPKRAHVFRILLMGPGLQRIGEAASPASLLQKRLNRGCTDCFEVLDASVDGYFSPEYVFLLEKVFPEALPDLVIYYESGVFLSAEILHNFYYEVDQDQDSIVRKDADRLYGDVCCSTVLNVFGAERRKKINLVLNFINVFRDAKKRDIKDMFTIIDTTIHAFDQMSSISKGKFLVLLAPGGYKPDRVIFADDFLQQILFKFLVYFYMPSDVSLGKVFYHQGFNVAVEKRFDEIYQPAYLAYRHSYNLNTTGADLWSKIAARKIHRYLKDTPRGNIER